MHTDNHEDTKSTYVTFVSLSVKFVDRFSESKHIFGDGSFVVDMRTSN